jgi:hypothetical protein
MKTIEAGRPGDAAEEALIKEARRRQRRRQFAIGAGVVLALAGGVAALRGTSHPRPPSAHHSTSSPKQLPAKMTGLPMPAGTNLRLLLMTDAKPPGLVKAAWYSTATRRTERIAHLPAADYSFDRVGGGWSAGAWVLNSACLPRTCTGPPVRAYFIADGSLTATRIGAGFHVAPSARAGAVWLVSYSRSTDNWRTTPARVQLVSTTGQPLSPRYLLPAGYLLDRGVGNYLLLNSVRARPPYVSELWDPRTGQVVRRVDNVFATGPDQIAWSPGCRGCQAQVLNVSTGKSVTIPIRGGQLYGIFSDDGRLLAVQLPSDGACNATLTGSTCSGTGGALGVFNTGTGAFTVIPGTVLRFSIEMSFLWQPEGHRLIILAAPGNGGYPSSSDATQVGYWDPGDTRLRVATIHPPGGLGPVVAVTVYPGQ